MKNVLNLLILLYLTCQPALLCAQGCVLVDPSAAPEAQMKSERTIYEIQDTIDLGGQTLTIPPECVLRFNGGIIRNGTVVFDDTHLDGLVRFAECAYSGRLSNQEVTLSWFGASPALSDNSAIINDVVSVSRAVVVVDALYPIGHTITIGRRVLFRGLDWSESVYATMLGNAHYGFRTTSPINAIAFSPGGCLSMFGISVVGDATLYVSGNTHDKDGPDGHPLQTCGIMMKTDAGAIDAIFDCSFVGFTYGIRAVGRYIEKIKGTYFSACRFGLFTAWTSDYICQDCHFNTNMLNYNIQAHGIDDSMPDRLRQTGAGAVVKGGGMVRFLDCKFEFNFIHLIIDEACIIFNLENCIFDAATHSCIMLFNEKSSDNWLIDSELHKPSINCINISGNTFCRGARCERWQDTSLPGSGILYVRESGDRGMNVSFVNNVVVDNIEVDQVGINYEKTIFRIYNDGCGGVINSGANDFSHCEAESVATAVEGSSGRFTIRDSGSNFGHISHQYRGNSIIDIQKMERDGDGRIIIWNTLTNGDSESTDTVIQP
ncbi:MAG: hypothetical protein K5945_09605 [Bacteroidaceae bacterium]|nr:hypothetical protein [Bacteroidaceae bacterium]